MDAPEHKRTTAAEIRFSRGSETTPHYSGKPEFFNFPLLRTLKGYLAFNGEQEKLLRQLKKPMEKTVDNFVNHFYRHLLRYPETKRLLSDRLTVERLKQLQRDYFLELFCGRYDQQYAWKRLQIGLTHERIGLKPVWYLGAYALYFQHCLPQIYRVFRNRPNRAQKATLALSKLLLLDMQLAVQAYLQRAMEVIQEQNQRLAQLVADRTSQLRDLEAGYSDLVENSPEMIFVVDRGRNFLSMNRTGLAKLGFALEEMRQLKLDDIVPPAYRLRVMEHISEVISDGYSELEAVLLSKEGKTIEVEINSTALYNPQGDFLKARSFGRDVTERKQLERQLLRWERLASVGSMSAKVAHEIKNPLSALSLNLELLADEIESYTGADTAEARQLMQSMSSELERLLLLTEEYLQFARLPKQITESVGIRDLLHRLVPLLGAELHRRGIELDLRVPVNLPQIEADKNQLMQVFLNLIRNAEEAMPAGGKISITGALKDGIIEVQVSDTGVGIEKENLSKIFDPFYTTKDTGTGLGLSFIHQVMRELKGRVTVASEKTKGTTFTLMFPYGS